MLVNKILESRGFDESVLETNRPNYNAESFLHYNEAMDFLKRMIVSNKPKYVSYDVDIDGFCSGTIVSQYLKKIGVDVIDVFHARKDGHGIEKQLDQIDMEKGGFLIITDSSTNDNKTLSYLKEMGIEVLVLDHHEVDSDNEFKNGTPDAIIINPMLEDCEYPNKDMVGASVCYTIIESFDDNNIGAGTEEFRDLAGFGLIADVASMIEPENRFFVESLLMEQNNAGLRAIIHDLKIDREDLNTRSFSYKISPLLNACLRTGKEELVYRFFNVENDVQMILIVEDIKNQKAIQKDIVANIMDKLEIIETKKAVIAQSSEAIGGITGLIANELTKRYRKHAFVFNDKLKPSGSSRSFDNAKILKSIENIKSVSYARGHQEAFGIEIHSIEDFVKDIDKNLKSDNSKGDVSYDVEVASLDMMDMEDLDKINRITGKHFPNAVVKMKCTVLETKEGRNKNFHELTTMEEVVLMDFSYSENKYKGIDYFSDIEVIGEPNVNIWVNPRTKKKTVKLQIIIQDLKEV